MRQIKFRGKRVDGLGWAYGSLNTWQDGTCEISHSELNDEMIKSKVDPATVGQFTGLLDKNGKEIYEGDIVVELFGTKGTVLYKHCSFMIEWKADVYSELLGWKNFNRGSASDGKELEVVSSIHDSPSLTNH